MVLDATLYNTKHYKVRIKGKVEQSREWNRVLAYGVVAIEKEAFGSPSIEVANFTTTLPSRLNKGSSPRFWVGSRVRHETPEEERRISQLKRCEYNNKDEVNSSNILSDKNHSFDFFNVLQETNKSWYLDKIGRDITRCIR